MTQMNKDLSEILKTVTKQPDSEQNDSMKMPETTEQLESVKKLDESLE